VWPSLHATLLTDASGVARARRWGTFERAVSVTGRCTITDEIGLKPSSSGEEEKTVRLQLRTFKLHALHAAILLYNRTVVVDADVYFCDALALRGMLGSLSEHDLVVASASRDTTPHPDCAAQLRLAGLATLDVESRCMESCGEPPAPCSRMRAHTGNYGGPAPLHSPCRFANALGEVNSGVLAFRSSGVTRAFLRRWRELYIHYQSTPCGAQHHLDQKPLRFLLNEAREGRPPAFSRPVQTCPPRAASKPVSPHSTSAE